MRRDKSPRTKLQVTDWMSEVASLAPGPEDFAYVYVTFKNTRFGFYSNPEGLPLKIGDLVAVEAQPGHDIGRVALTGPLVAAQMQRLGLKDREQIKKVFRIARDSDIEKYEEAKEREHDTMIRARKISEELGLDMKIGDVEYQGDGMKAIFYYIANERVDFRKLIRVLADAFKVRIEMKQIGARQEAGRIGGIGPCGRALCCSTWISHFVSVGTGAARLQDLSMNPQKLAGQCAKLKCCLNYEMEAYTEAHKELPGRDITLETKDATYYWFKPDILARTITYSTDKNIPANLVTIPAARAFEIIALNKQGVKVDELSETSEDADVTPPAYIDLAGQDSLTRFDRNKKSRKGRRNKEENRQNRRGAVSQPQTGDGVQHTSKQASRHDRRRNNRRDNNKVRGNKVGNESGGQNQ